MSASESYKIGTFRITAAPNGFLLEVWKVMPCHKKPFWNTVGTYYSLPAATDAIDLYERPQIIEPMP